MPKTKAEYCRWHAERMLTLAKECGEPSIRELVQAMAKNWADMALVEDARNRTHPNRNVQVSVF